MTQRTLATALPLAVILGACSQEQAAQLPEPGMAVQPRSTPATVHAKGWSSSDRQDAFRPQLHYTPSQNWMNDPNGLVFFDGEYHLFYQYNPEGNQWGNMSWGHAVSTDLLHWQELGVALPQRIDDNGTPSDTSDDRIEQIFSGSVVIDTDNQSGLGNGTDPVMLAYYTSAYNYDAPGRGRQAQSLAYSTDNGRTWSFYSQNPLIAIDPANNPNGYNANEFRDPKVFHYEPHDKWVMPVVLPLDHKVQFYQSTDFLNWSLMSEFGPANSDSGMWEMPDLFPIAVDGDSDNEKWVMALSVNGGTPYGGSGIQYFVGDFDGTTFTADNLTPKTYSGGSAYENFENGFGQWTLTGDAFGQEPASGALTDRTGNPIQGTVTGYEGTGLINTFRRHDQSVGVATSDPFTLTTDYINLRIGGGHHPFHNRSRAGILSHPGSELFESFDRDHWGAWQASGNAFTDTGGADSTSPFNGWYDGIDGIEGTSLLHSYRPDGGGDAATGTLVSPTFTVDRPYLHFKIGGGFHPPGDPNGETVIELIVDGSVRRWATGFDANVLHWRSWDLSAFQGQTAHIEISDQHGGGWGQIQVDQLVFSDEPAPYLAPRANLLFGFDGDDFEGWSATGTAFNNKPGHGGWNALPNFLGNGLVHSFNTDEGGDAATGTLTSPTFTLTQPFLNALVGGGNKPAGHPDGEARIKLMVNGQEVASATGTDANRLFWHSWDVTPYLGQSARLVISDQNTASWGQIQVDHITASDAPIDAPYAPEAPRSEATAVNLLIDGQPVRTATGENSEQLDWAVWDVSDRQGETARLEVVDFNRGGWGHLLVDDLRFADTPAPDAARRADWVDWGKDFYAGITFHNYPGTSPVWLAWSNNWQYGGQIPTSPFRGTQSLVRSLGLTDAADGPVLTQQPVGIDSLRIDGTPFSWSSAVTLNNQTEPFGHAFEAGSLLDIDWVLEPQGAAESDLRLRYGAQDWVDVVYNADDQTLAIDRTNSGQTGFHPEFPGIHAAPVTLDSQGRVSVRLILDWSMMEVFAQNGRHNITDRFFPPQTETIHVEAFARDGQATVHALNVHRLTSIWAD